MRPDSFGHLGSAPSPAAGTMPGAAVAVRPPGWWARNWKWAAPAGALALIGAFVAFFVLLVVLVFGLLKHSEVYQTAIAEAQREPAVIGALGVPIEEGFLVMGNIEINGPSGSADLAIPISGPDGGATIYVVAQKRAGAWEYETLEVAVQHTGDTIDLLGDW